MNSKDRPIQHWIERLGEEVIARKKEPYTILSGITTSGPTHVGTLCEFLYAHAVFTYLNNIGRKATFYFIADILDAFDAVPAPLSQYEPLLSKEIGKPLAHVPDPLGCHSSLGDHFLADTIEVMKKLDVHPTILRATDLYARGTYDTYALMYLRNVASLKDIIEKTSARTLPKTWSPLMPICANCGRIATTTVVSFSSDGSYTYTCTCNHRGDDSIFHHHYKLVWRLDWPARQDFLNASAEGAGVDHMTRGGSWDTAREIHEKIFQKAPPIVFKFGFVLLEGKKYSKSKGLGLSVAELLSLVPPEIIKYALFRPDIHENKNFDPTGEELLKLYDDFLYAHTHDTQTRADRKKRIAATIAGSLRWKLSFSDYLLSYQIYGNLDTIKHKDPEGCEYLFPYLREWVSRGFAPDVYDFTYEPKPPDDPLVREFFQSLPNSADELAIHNALFTFARAHNQPPEEFFKKCYRTILNKDRGPKFGRLVASIGVERIKRDLGL